MKPLPAVLVLVCAIVAGDRHTTEQSQPAPDGSPVRLLPGYQHAPSAGVDAVGGRIWRDGGPEIYYNIGFSVGELARGYSKQNPTVPLTVLESPATGEMVVALDDAHDAMVVSVDHHANFDARHVRSRRDVVDVLLMANTVPRLPK